MNSSEDIEIQLWEYIDQVCDQATQIHIAQLIATDSVWKQKYAELTALNTTLGSLEPEHTSMRFSKNVMEAITTEHVAKPTKSYINKWVVRGIAAVFALLIGFVLVYSLQDLQWTDAPATNKVDYSNLFNRDFVVYVVLANLLLAVVFIDAALRKKLKH